MELKQRKVQQSESDLEVFREAASRGNLVPLIERVFADQLTPVLAYRCLVKEDERDAPSFLFESVVNGDQQVCFTCLMRLQLSVRPFAGMGGEAGAV